jgi:hypothetical protein
MAPVSRSTPAPSSTTLVAPAALPHPTDAAEVDSVDGDVVGAAGASSVGTGSEPVIRMPLTVSRSSGVVGVGVGVGVTVGVAVGVGVGVAVRVGRGVEVGAADGLPVFVAVGRGLGLAVDVPPGLVEVATGVGAAVAAPAPGPGVSVGVGAAPTTTRAAFETPRLPSAPRTVTTVSYVPGAE